MWFKRQQDQVPHFAPNKVAGVHSPRFARSFQQINKSTKQPALIFAINDFPNSHSQIPNSNIKDHLTILNNLFHRGPFSQLNQISQALPTMRSSGTNPQKRESCDP